MPYIQQLILAACSVLNIDYNLIDYDTDIEPDDAAIAYCDYDDDMVTISINPAYLEHEHLIEYIAHEMIHAQQFLSGRLVNVSHIVTLWDGQEHINSSAFGYISEAEKHELYLNQPWELDAYGRQVEVANQMLTIME